MADPVAVAAPVPGDALYRDHAEQMLERLPDQFRSKTDATNNIAKMLTAISVPVQDLETACQQVLRQRSIDNAIGAQLDAIGRIVNEARGGADDDNYRRRVRARISVHRSKGGHEDLIKVTDLIVFDDDAYIHVIPQTPATVIVRVEDVAVSDSVADTVLFGFLQDTVATGVRVILESGSHSPEEWFTFDSTTAHGYDNGFFIDARG